MNIPDHPVIRNMEATGTPDGKAEQYPRCPACGEDLEFDLSELVDDVEEDDED